MRTWLNKHFGFSKGEFNGLIFLISIIIILKSLPFIYGYFKPVEEDESNLLAQIQKISVGQEERFHYTKNSIEEPRDQRAGKLFNFDPNTIDVGGWQELGLSAKQAQSIINYRNKGGKFYKAEDLQKMYTVSPEMYQKLLPYVQIENQQTVYPKKDFQLDQKAYVKKPLVMVDVNLADSAQLDQIKGIGPAFALRILKYRERLGGFYKKEQLMEVYGLDSVKYNEIKDQIMLSEARLKIININTAAFEDLKSNPYLSYKQINAIIQYRKQHGKYAGVADLSKIANLTPQVIEKISRYISF
ncbi:ComEA family DNA-binding protein [Pedobacter punctiformis]|uniref:Helix-hairpin-helix domain-containing protein n=1 Tax=Pedobacter punctiformis TaxID=3004097 RepID=A0ABT4L9I0_9SPHI|nr:helix-hairpin-helix domain-containing protein [Pedobacter sp. HCMS5-2]MCZ4244575.1 helix-hairpin-helix domain-containing protein [Pedobacter sp. HCMS5-2]